MRIHSILLAGLLLGAGAAHAAPRGRDIPNPDFSDASRPPMDIVFAIDCSGSMGPVIETAKQKIWDIVNDAARAKPAPRLRIGLLGYGDASRTYREFDLSGDLDSVYQHLSTFKDEGWSEEYVGEAIQKSIEDMSWSSPRPGVPALRTIYVVGNETAQQGPIRYQLIAPIGKERGIFINAIYCGDAGGQDTWRQFASQGGGEYMEIAGNGGSVMLPTPYDGPIGMLNNKLNGTYLPYGLRGRDASANQAAQDSNALRAGGAYANAARALAKAGNQYRNAEWDLVDKSREVGFDLDKIPAEELPPAMRAMTPQGRRDFLAQKQRERADLQKQLQELGAKRAEFLRRANEKSGRKDSLDAAIGSTFSAQARAGGFSIGR